MTVGQVPDEVRLFEEVTKVDVVVVVGEGFEVVVEDVVVVEDAFCVVTLDADLDVLWIAGEVGLPADLKVVVEAVLDLTLVVVLDLDVDEAGEDIDELLVEEIVTVDEADVVVEADDNSKVVEDELEENVTIARVVELEIALELDFGVS